VRPEHGKLGVAVEGRLTGKAFVEQATQRVEVGAGGQLLALDHLRRDVLDRADDLPGRGESGLGGNLLRQPEVAEVTVLP
jgi:hypothetical protein